MGWQVCGPAPSSNPPVTTLYSLHHLLACTQPYSPSSAPCICQSPPLLPTHYKSVTLSLTVSCLPFSFLSYLPAFPLSPSPAGFFLGGTRSQPHNPSCFLFKFLFKSISILIQIYSNSYSNLWKTRPGVLKPPGVEGGPT